MYGTRKMEKPLSDVAWAKCIKAELGRVVLSTLVADADV